MNIDTETEARKTKEFIRMVAQNINDQETASLNLNPKKLRKHQAEQEFGPPIGKIFSGWWSNNWVDPDRYNKG